MRFGPLLLAALIARHAAGQTAGSARSTTIRGTVRDSVARGVLAGALVQLVSADTQTSFGGSAVSDSFGRFAIDDVPNGRYTIGFFHPMLDSLGIAPTLREVRVDGRDSVQADLSIPSAARLRVAMCGPRTAQDSGAVVMGVVRDARDRTPTSGVTVVGGWLELSFGREGVVHRQPRVVATTKENGWFALCDVPSPGTMTLQAIRGHDSTDVIELRIPADGFLRRELFLAPGQTESRLSGTVVTADGQRPVPGAQVSILFGPQTRANEGGEWTIPNSPAGTRMLEVRAVSFYPERRAIDVVANAAPIPIVLSTLKAVLDTVKIVARRALIAELHDFEERRRTGLGFYLSARDVSRRKPLVLSDLLRSVPGLRIDRTVTDSTSLLMRATVDARPTGNVVVDTIATFLRRDQTGSGDWCSPAIFLDGQLLRGLSTQDLDEWVHPEVIVGIEVYRGISVPAQFQAALIGCGSIVIWTK